MNRNEKAPGGLGLCPSNHFAEPDKLKKDYINQGGATANYEGFLSMLDVVKEIPAKKHARSAIALCTAHQDKNPSLCVDLTHCGRILLFCRAGCGVADILAAVGLSMSDLYPDNDYKRPPGYTQKEIDYFLTVAQVAEQYRRNGRKPRPTDLDLINRALKVLHFTKKQILQGLRDGI